MAQKKTKETSGSGLKFAAALIGAAAIGHYLYGPQSEKNRKKIKAWTIKAKGEVLEQFEKHKELTEEQYHGIVESVTKKYGKLKTVGEVEATKLGKELKKHWKEIKKSAEEDSSKKK